MILVVVLRPKGRNGRGNLQNPEPVTELPGARSLICKMGITTAILISQDYDEELVRKLVDGAWAHTAE